MRKFILFLILAITASAAVADTPVAASDNTEAGSSIPESLVLKYCKWYISTPPSADPAEAEAREGIASLIVNYISETKDFNLKMTGAVLKMLELNGPAHNSDLLGVYLAGETIYCLEHNLKNSNATSFANAMVDVVNYYAMLPEHNIKSLNKYLDMDNAKRLKKFEKFYNNN